MAGSNLIFDIFGRDKGVGKVFDDVKGKADGLKGVFGGVGKLAAGAFAVTGLIGLGAGLGSFVGGALEDLKRVEIVNTQTSATIKSTGGAAGVSAKQVSDLATSLEGLTATEAETIQQGANTLLTFTNIKNAAGEGNDVFDQATVALTDYSRAMGVDMQGAAIQVGKALNDPVKGVTALGKAGVQFTDQQRDMIDAMVEAGDTAGAQKIILGELNTQFGGSAAAYAGTTAGKIELLGHAWGNLGETLLGAVAPALGQFADLGTEAIKWVTESPGMASMSAWLGGLPGLLTGAGGGLASITGPFRALFAAFAAGGSDITSSGVAGAFEVIGFGARAIWDAISPLVPTLLELVMAFSPLGILLQALAPVLPQIAGMAAMLASVLGATLQQVLIMLVPVFQMVAAAIVQMVQALLPIIPVILQLVSALLPPLMAMFMQLATTVIPPLASIIQMLVPVFLMVVTAVMSLLQALLPIIPVILQLVTALLPPLMTAFMQLALAVIPPLAQTLAMLVPVIVSLIAMAIVPLVQMLSVVLPAVINALLPIVLTVFTFIADTIRNAMTIIQGIIQVVTGIISGNWSQVWSGIQQIVAGIWAQIGNIIATAINLVRNVISGGLQTVQAIVSGVLGFIGSLFSSIFGNVTSAAGNMIGDVIGFFTSLPGRIKGALAGAGSWLLGAGADIVQGLINGISSLAGSIGNVFLNLLPGWIRGPFKLALGINSPSKEFAGYGANIGEGVVQGVSGMRGAVASAVGSLVDVPDVGALNLGASAAAASGRQASVGSGAGAQQQGGTGPDDLKDAIRDGLSGARFRLMVDGRELYTTLQDLEFAYGER
ncbi:phage tail protein [Arthrobacter sp. Hz1]